MNDKMLKLIKQFLNLTFLKFALVGGINTLFGFAVMFVFYNACGFSYWFSSVCNYIVGGVVSYFLNKYFTFKNKERSWRQVASFVLTLVICYAVSYSASKLLSEWLFNSLSERIRGNIALLVGAILYVGLNFLGQKHLVFKSK